MHEARLIFTCNNANIIKKSLEPDMENNRGVKTAIRTTKKAIEIRIKSKKLSYLKAIINSYISSVDMLIETDKNIE